MSEVAAPAAPAAQAAAPSAPATAPIVSDDPKTAAQAPAPTDGEAKPDPKPAEKPESRDNTGRDRRKMSRLYREAAEQRARADLLEKQLSEHKPKPQDEGAPRLDQYNDIEKYAEAKAKYESKKALDEHSEKQRAETHKQMQTRLTEEWEGKAERASAKYEDFEEVVGEIQPTTPWAQALMEADNGEDIAYHLGKNLKEARRIAALPPLSQAREIGKLEAKLAAEPKKPQTPSKAPAPIAPLTGVSQVSSNDSDKAWFQKRLSGKR